MSHYSFDPLQGKLVNTDGTPTQAFIVYWQKFRTNLEEALTGLEDAVAAVAAAQAAADAANSAAEAAQTAADTANSAAAAVTAESSLANSFVENFTPPIVSADSAGLVTIANHDRHYGDGTVVAVTGNTVATGQAAGIRVHIYYDQASRAGGAVTYQYSTDEADAAQLGDRHNVGAVEIPAAGTADGGYARPPGYGGFEP